MRHAARCLAGALALCLVLACGICPAPAAERAVAVAAKRAALVIGNAAYRAGPLANPANDANDMAEALGQAGFTVIRLVNADQRTMEKGVRDFGAMLGPGSVGLFYFAGHGMQVDGRNYLIPIGANIGREFDVKYEAVDAGRVLDEMRAAGNGLNLVILDACRNNPFARSFRSADQGLARMDAPTGTLIAYATAPGATAADGQGRNGVYTRHLLAHLRAPGLPVEEVLKRVRVDVMQETGNLQVPWEASSLTGTFVFQEAPEPSAPQRDEEMQKLHREMAEMRALLAAQEARTREAAQQAQQAQQASREPAPAPMNEEMRRQNEELRQQVEEIKQLQLAALEQKQGPDPEKEALRKELDELRGMRTASTEAAKDRETMAAELDRLKGMLKAPPEAKDAPALEVPSRYSLAVAPYRLEVGACISCREHVENILRKAQARNLDLFHPAWSPVPSELPGLSNPLPTKYAKEGFARKLWARSTPDAATMAEMGRDLGVDAVLALRMEYIHPNPIQYSVHLLDVRTGQVLTRNLYRPTGTAPGTIWTRKVLKQIDEMAKEFDADRLARAGP